MHAKLRVHKTVTVGANLHRLIYNLLIAIVFSYTFCYQSISAEDMLNKMDLVALTGYQQVN